MVSAYQGVSSKIFIIIYLLRFLDTIFYVSMVAWIENHHGAVSWPKCQGRENGSHYKL